MGEDRQATRAKLSTAIAEGTVAEFEAVDGTGTVLVVNPLQIDGFMHSPTTAKP